MTTAARSKACRGWRYTRILGFGALLLLVGATASCGGDDGGGGGDREDGSTDTTLAPDEVKEPEPGGELVFGLTGETDVFNPASGRWSPSAFNVARAVYDPITSIDLEGIAQPYLVESIESNEALTEWTITLREGIEFHNGDLLTAEVLSTHIKTMQLSPLSSFAFDPVDAVIVLASGDEGCASEAGCVVVFTNQPWGTFPAILSGQTGYVVHPGMHDGTFVDPVGTGPFVFEEWVRDDHLTVVRNDSYWREGMPYLDKVTFIPLTDPSSRLTALSSGDIDLFHTNDAEQLISFGADGSDIDEGYSVTFDGSSGDEMHMVLDTQSGPTSDPEIRRALVLGTDREALNQGLYDGFFEVADGPYREDEYWWSDSGWPEPDAEAAKAIIEEWEAENDELVIDYKVVAGNEGLTLAQAIQQQWEPLGIEMQIQQLDQTAFANALLVGDFDAMQIQYYNRSDPDEMFHFWDPDQIGEPEKLSLNFSRYTSETQDRVLHEAREIDDPAARKALYAELWADWGENFPYLWLYHVEWVIAAKDDIENIGTFTFPDGEPAAPMDWGAVFLTDVWIDS